jgi:hypothetical protein
MILLFLQQAKLNSWMQLSRELEGLEGILKLPNKTSNEVKLYCEQIPQVPSSKK